MAQSRDYDVVVVGGSIAGCTAAIQLGRAGARVAVLDQRPDPAAYKTICTHFIQASATPTIERLGLAERIEAAGGVRNGVELWSEFGWVRPVLSDSYPYPRYGYDIRREKLDPMIRQLAAETPGVELLMGQTVVSLLGSNGRPTGVRAERPGAPGPGNHGARGRRPPTVVTPTSPRWPASEPRVIPHGRSGYFAYFRNLPLATGDCTQLWLLNPDFVYAFPQDDDITLLAVFPTKDRMAWFKHDLEANFQRYYEGLPNGPEIRKGERISKFLGKLDMPNTIRPAGQPGLAFVGDAAMAADPVWGVGCGWAFQSGEWLAQELGPALSGSASDTAARRSASTATASVTAASCSDISCSLPITRAGGDSTRSSASSSRLRSRTRAVLSTTTPSARVRCGRTALNSRGSWRARPRWWPAHAAGRRRPIPLRELILRSRRCPPG